MHPRVKVFSLFVSSYIVMAQQGEERVVRVSLLAQKGPVEVLLINQIEKPSRN
jgi:hypothetical protein